MRNLTRRDRRGATLVETALVLLVFMILVFGTLDLGLAVFRHQILAEAARQGARRASVHGGLADRLGAWGPATLTVQADQPLPLTDAIRPWLADLDPAHVTVLAVWPDGGNDPRRGHRVAVTLTVPYRPMTTLVMGSPSITLRAASTVLISH